MKKNVKTGLVSARRTLRTAATFSPPSHFLEIAELRNCTCEECELLAVSYLVSSSAGLEGKPRRRGQRFLQASRSPLLMGCEVPRPRWRRRSFGSTCCLWKAAVGQRYDFYTATKDTSEISISGLTARWPETPLFGWVISLCTKADMRCVYVGGWG